MIAFFRTSGIKPESIESFIIKVMQSIKTSTCEHKILVGMGSNEHVVGGEDRISFLTWLVVTGSKSERVIG